MNHTKSTKGRGGVDRKVGHKGRDRTGDKAKDKAQDKAHNKAGDKTGDKSADKAGSDASGNALEKAGIPIAGQAGGMIAVQGAAAEVVGRVLGGRNLDRVLENVLSQHPGFSAGERSAVHSISFDSLRHYGLLSAQLELLLSQPISDEAVRHLLLVALAQLQFSKAAAHAIVDHAVNAVAAIGFPRAKALVNAVLRNFLRQPDQYLRERFTQDIATYDFPPWWIARVQAEYPDQWQPLLLSARTHPPMWLRVNARRGTRADYVARLAAAGLSVAGEGDASAGNAVLLAEPQPVATLPGFAEGLVSVQDLGAQRACALLAPAAGMRVLDACAAPGGKTGHLLEAADVRLLALDSDAKRLKRVRDNLTRLGLSAELKCADAVKLKQWWDGVPFERILIDAPCSGSGVVRRHPDIKWIRRESDLTGFARQQRELLEALWQCLANGGRLLYATCSVFRAENGDIIEQFLQKTANARLLSFEPFAAFEPDPLASRVTGRGDAAPAAPGGQLLPDHVQDGFFYALLEKTR